MKLPRGHIRLFREDEQGGVAVAFAVLLIPVIGAFGAAIDYSRAAAARTAMQASLDAAALNAVMSAGSLDQSQLYEIVNKSFQATFRPEQRDHVFNIVITPTFDPPSRTLTVSGSGTLNTRIMNIVGLSTMQIATLAKAGAPGEPGACVIVLDPSATKAMSISGNGSVNVPNCQIYVNSTANVALEQKGSSSLNAKSIKVVGHTNGSNINPKPEEKQDPATDPLAGLTEPVVPGACTYMNKTFSVTETLPGDKVYCGNINFDGNLTLGKGIHYFKNANVSVGSSSNITGDEVMLYFDGSSSFFSTSSGTFKIKSQLTGPYAGIAVFGSRTGTFQNFVFRGSKEYFVDGTIYLPNAHFDLKGTSDLTVSSKSGYVIAKRFSYSGDSSFTFDAHGGVVPSAMSKMRPVLTQ